MEKLSIADEGSHHNTSTRGKMKLTINKIVIIFTSFIRIEVTYRIRIRQKQLGEKQNSNQN